MPKFSPFERALSGVASRPLLAGAALAAPLFAKDEDRGYFQTALVTTPLIYGAAALVPNIPKTARQAAARAQTVARNVSQAIAGAELPVSSIADIRKMASEGAAPNHIDRALRNYMRSGRGPRLRDFEKEREAMGRVFRRHYTYDEKVYQDLKNEIADLESLKNSEQIPWNEALGYDKQLKPLYRKLDRIEQVRELQKSKPTLLGKSLRGAVMDAFTPTDWASRTGLPELPSTNQALIEVFEANQHKPEFIHSLRRRLRQVRQLNEPVRGDFAADIWSERKAQLGDLQGSLHLSEDVDFHFKGTSNTWWKDVSEEYKNTLRNLQDWQVAGTKYGESKRLLVVSEKVLSGETGSSLSRGRAVGFVARIERQNAPASELFIPLPDQTGEVVKNAHAGSKGVGRYILNAQGRPVRIDEWVSSQMLNGHTFEALQGDIDRGAYWGGVDPIDTWKANLWGDSAQVSRDLLTTSSINIRSRVAVPSTLPIYPGAKGNLVTIDKLDAKATTQFMRDALNTGLYSTVNPDRAYLFRLPLKDLDALNLYGLPSVEKQDSAYRSLTKGTRLRSVNPAASRAPYSVTGQESLSLGDTAEAGIRVGMVSPEEKAFFATLPQQADEFAVQRTDILARMIDPKGNLGMSPEAAEQMLDEVQGVYDKGQQQMFSMFGRLGETEIIGRQSYASGLGLVNRSIYEMKDVRVDAGHRVTPGQVLGFDVNDNPVLADFAGTVDHVWGVADSSRKNGGVRMVVQNQLDMEGAKFDLNGVKGLFFTAPEDRFELARRMYNRLASLRGKGNYLAPDIHAISDVGYLANKVSAPEAQMALVADLYNRARDLPTKNPLRQNLLGLFKNYFKKAPEISVRDARSKATFQILVDSERMARLSREERLARAEQLMALNNDLLEQAGHAIRNAGSTGHTFFAAFSTSARDYEKFAMQAAMPGTIRFWDHLGMYVPNRMSVTHDMFTFASLSQNFEAAKELGSRVQFVGGGDPSLSLAFGEHLIRGEGTLGEIIPASEVNLPTGHLSQAEGLAGTIFDPAAERFKQNFTLDLGEMAGSSKRLVAIPGTGAYHAGGNPYAQAEYEVKDWQRAAQKIFSATNGKDRDAAVEAYETAVKADLLVGKKSSFRPSMYDPDGVAGFLRTRTNPAIGADPSNAFEVAIGPEQLSRIRNSQIAESLAGGGTHYGMLFRQPTSEAFHVRVKYDPSLTGGYGIGISEALRGPYQADFDKDIGGLSLWTRGSEAEKEAIEAIESGRQMRQLKTFERLHTAKEDSLRQTAEVKGLTERLYNHVVKAAEPVENLENTLASSRIGQFSNALTDFMEAANDNARLLLNEEQAALIKYGLFDIRQAPINARKAHNAFSLEQAEKLGYALMDAWRQNDPLRASTKLQTTLQQMATDLSKDETTAARKLEVYQSEGMTDALRTLFQGRTEESKIRAALLTTNDLPRVEEALNKAGRMGFDKVFGIARGGSPSADATASTLGAINETIASEASVLGNEARAVWQDFRSAHGGKVLAAAAGLAALGILSTPAETPRASFDRPSANKYRPEETLSGSDHIPGEPVTGSMAPSNPPRTVQPGPQGVSRAVVAPMGTRRDTEVTMQARDRDAAAEQARYMAKLSQSGPLTTIINYRSNLKPYSLRHREKVREILENQ